ncbi:MAG: hypothetical protein FWG40_02475 [Peptococcaceae bacterium]|nr:hypothetical protein [Peptococcaceae bacterium]
MGIFTPIGLSSLLYFLRMSSEEIKEAINNAEVIMAKNHLPVRNNKVEANAFNNVRQIYIFPIIELILSPLFQKNYRQA